MLAGTPVDGPIAGERVTIPTAAGPATAIGVPDPDSQVSPIDVLLVTFTNLLNGLALGDEITAANQQELAMLIRV